MTTILALETATETCSVALRIEGRVYARFEHAQRMQTERLLPMVDDVLREAGVDLQQVELIALGAGPGAFTGLRVATAAAQGLAYALNVPVAPVSTLATLAMLPALSDGIVFSCFDARMGQVYAALYEKHGLQLQERIAPALLDPAHLPQKWMDVLANNAVIAAGNGLCHAETFAAQGVQFSELHPHAFPRAEDMLVLADAVHVQGLCVQAADVEPVYLRDKVAWVAKPAQSAG